MARRSRSLFAAVTALALGLLASLLSVSAATAAAGQEILLFANGAVSDTTGVDGHEVDDFETALLASGATVTRFDGGGGSASAWETALTGIDILAFPEVEGGDPLYTPGPDSGDWLSDAAAASIASWVNAGGHIIFVGSRTTSSNDSGIPELMTELTGLDYTSVWETADLFDETSPVDSHPAIADVTLPDPLPAVNGTYAVNDFNLWDATLLAPLTPIYTANGGSDLTVGVWTVGTGSISYLSYDYYFESGYTDPTEVADWTTVNSWLLTNTGAGIDDGGAGDGDAGDGDTGDDAEGSALAETGIDGSTVIVASGAGILLLVGFGLVLVRRSKLS